MARFKTYYYKQYINADYWHIWFQTYRLQPTIIDYKFVWWKLGYRYYFSVNVPNSSLKHSVVQK